MSAKKLKTYQKKIIAFMKGKAKNIPDKNWSKIYFTKKDAEDILKWSDVLAKKIWRQLIHNIEDCGTRSLGNDSCPYCIKYDDNGNNCTDVQVCEYDKNHGHCYDTDSDYNILVSKVKGIHLKFSNKFFIALIEKIEE